MPGTMANPKGLKLPEAYNGLTPIIHDIYREVIAIDKKAKAAAVLLMDKVVDYVVKKLLEMDETFQHVYLDKRRVGSYFDGLRVTEPTEFDVNVVLQFPFHRQCKIKQSTPGYVQVRVKSLREIKRDEGKIKGDNIRRIDPKLERMVDSRGFIRRDKVLSWWQSIFAKALQAQLTLNIENDPYTMTWSTSGPAITLHVKNMSTGKMTDIDVVPVMRFDTNTARYPTPVFQSLQARQPNLPKEWYIVPKPVHDDDTQRRWRLSFTDQEKILMSEKENLKPSNKLMKRLRDKAGWKLLDSYMIKTIFLHETGHLQSFYHTDLGNLFVHFLSTLKDYLERRKLPFYWHGGRNMFSKIPKATLANIGNNVKNMLATIDKLLDKPKELEKYARSLFI